MLTEESRSNLQQYSMRRRGRALDKWFLWVSCDRDRAMMNAIDEALVEAGRAGHKLRVSVSSFVRTPARCIALMRSMRTGPHRAAASPQPSVITWSRSPNRDGDLDQHRPYGRKAVKSIRCGVMLTT
jgi:hypothetical protein